jgi:hypothetical protein
VTSTEKRLKIDYRMDGVLNGVPIRNVGEGTADFDEGIEEVNIELSSIPDGWHPFLLPLICSGPSRVGISHGTDTVPSLMSLSDWHYFTEPGRLRLGELYNGAGMLLGRVAATGDYKREGDTLRYRIKMRSDVHLTEGLTGVEHYSYNLIPNGPGKAVVLSHFRVRSESGETLFGSTSIPYGFSSDTVLERPVAGVQFIDTQLSGLSFRYRTNTFRRFAPYETEELHEYFGALAIDE